MSTGPAPATIAVVYTRAGDKCEVCHQYLPSGVPPHHRRPRGAGGSTRADTNSPSNLLLLCLACHTAVERDRDHARAMGWLVWQGHDPATRPVLLLGPGWVLLTDSGRYLPTERSVA